MYSAVPKNSGTFPSASRDVFDYDAIHTSGSELNQSEVDLS